MSSPLISYQPAPTMAVIYDADTLSLRVWDGTLEAGSITIGNVVIVGAVPLPTGAATQTTLAALLAELALKADLTETQPVSMATVPAGAVALADTFKARADTYTGTGNGTTVTATSAPISVFAIQVKCTGVAATSWDVRLEGSLDGVNFTQILAHTNVTGDGVVLWLGAVTSPCLYFRSRCVGLVLGAATNIVATILGVDN